MKRASHTACKEKRLDLNLGLSGSQAQCLARRRAREGRGLAWLSGHLPSAACTGRAGHQGRNSQELLTSHPGCRESLKSSFYAFPPCTLAEEQIKIGPTLFVLGYRREGKAPSRPLGWHSRAHRGSELPASGGSHSWAQMGRQSLDFRLFQAWVLIPAKLFLCSMTLRECPKPQSPYL